MWWVAAAVFAYLLSGYANLALSVWWEPERFLYKTWQENYYGRIDTVNNGSLIAERRAFAFWLWPMGFVLMSLRLLTGSVLQRKVAVLREQEELRKQLRQATEEVERLLAAGR